MAGEYIEILNGRLVPTPKCNYTYEYVTGLLRVIDMFIYSYSYKKETHPVSYSGVITPTSYQHAC